MYSTICYVCSDIITEIKRMHLKMWNDWIFKRKGRSETTWVFKGEYSSWIIKIRFSIQAQNYASIEHCEAEYIQARARLHLVSFRRSATAFGQGDVRLLYQASQHFYHSSTIFFSSFLFHNDNNNKKEKYFSISSTLAKTNTEKKKKRLRFFVTDQ